MHFFDRRRSGKYHPPVRRTSLAAALVLLLVSGGAEAQVPGGWLTYGNDPARSSMTEASLLPAELRPAWYTPVSGRISSQALVAENVPAAGQRTVYVATSRGVVYALGENGYIRWRVELGQLDRICQQIDGYGITGTGVIDPATHALYVADAFGRLHALDLVTGAERAGWPVQLYTDHRRELVWAAMTLVNGSIYLGTGAYCDRPMVGKVIRVDLATKQVSRWVSVPLRLGGGGSVWGWGGVAYSPRRGSLFVATGNAFRGGSNVGKRFRESAGYGEHIVELSPDLTVRAAHHPPEMHGLDIGFAGSPVLFSHRFCGDLVAAVNKDGFVYVWRSDRVAAGTLFRLRLSRPTSATPLLSQPAYSPRTGAIYVATPGRLVRVDINQRCRGQVTWGRKVGNGLFNGSPTIAGDIVWLAENANRGTSLLGFDARSGASRFRSRLAGPTYVAPTVVGDRVYVGTYTGGVQAFALASGLHRPVGAGESALPEYRSFSSPLHGWASREDGVYATENGGASWRLLYPRSAIRVARVSAADRNAVPRPSSLGLRLPPASRLDFGRGRELAPDLGGARQRLHRFGWDALVVAGRRPLPRHALATRRRRAERSPRRPAARKDHRCQGHSRRRCRARQPAGRGPRLRSSAQAPVRAASPQGEGLVAAAG